MDSASEVQPQDHRQGGKDTQRGLTNDSQTAHEMSNPEVGNDEIGNAQQKSRMVEPQQLDGSDESVVRKGVSKSVGDIDSDATIEKELGVEKQEQLIVKIKHQKADSATPSSTSADIRHSSAGKHTQKSTSDDISEKRGVKDFVKKEPEDIDKPLGSHDASSQNPNTVESQIPGGDDRAASNQPLDESTHKSGHVDMIKPEPTHEEQQQVDHAKTLKGADAVNDGIHQGEDAMHAPNNDKALKEVSDTAHHGSSEMVHAEQKSDSEERREGGSDGGVHEKEGVEDQPQEGEVQNLHQDTTDNQLKARPDKDTLTREPCMADQAGEVEEQQLKSRRSYRRSKKTIPESEESDDDVDLEEEEVRKQPYEAKAGASTSRPGGLGAGGQRHHGFDEDIPLARPTLSSPRSHAGALSQLGNQRTFTKQDTPRQASQQPTGPYNPPVVTSEIDVAYTRRMRQLEQQRIQAAQNLYAIQQRNQQMAVGYDQSRLSMPPVMSMNYQGTPQGNYQYLEYGRHDLHSRYSGYTQQQQFGQVNPNIAYPPHGYNMSGRHPMPPTANNWIPGAYAAQGHPNIRRQVVEEPEGDEEEDISDDDEPLRTRVKRHPSVMSQDSVLNSSPPAIARVRGHQGSEQGQDSDIEFVTSNPKTKNPVKMKRPLPQPIHPTTPIKDALPSENETENNAFSFKLPQYEVQRQPLAKGEDVPSAKVSLPGLVREELLLSPDHTEQETHLLLNLFIPGQQALSTPDPEPATALLNFHTIAVMVIEAYVQYEIGDELGLGRGHFHKNHAQDDEEYERMRDATDANIDEIFFAVVDRWRAGLESKKQSLELIRGAQEFCDVALDVIYYIKEHGLLRPEPKVRRVRSDKGVRRVKKEVEEGKGKGRADVGVSKDKGVKRAAEQKVNELLPRKKGKIEKAVRAKPKKRSEPQLTVIRKR